MIITVRGTFGTGKTTFARRVIELYKQKASVRIAGRRQPLYYSLSNGPSSQLFVLGHYNSPCGGADTLKTLDQTFDLTRHLYASGHVFFEGALLSSEFNRTNQLGLDYGKENVHVIMLDVPVERCIAQVQQRRAEKGNDKELNPKNLLAKRQGTESVQRKLAAWGNVGCYTLSFDEAFIKVRELLGA